MVALQSFDLVVIVVVDHQQKKRFRSFYNVVGAMQDIATQAQKGGHVIKLVGPLT